MTKLLKNMEKSSTIRMMGLNHKLLLGVLLLAIFTERSEARLILEQPIKEALQNSPITTKTGKSGEQRSKKGLKSAKHPWISPETFPKNFSWQNVNGVNYLTQARNQHLPQYCGSCYAISAVTCLSDRINILRNGSFPRYNLAVQPILDCSKHSGTYGCKGGDPKSALKFIKKTAISEESCAPYIGKGYLKDGRECNSTSFCSRCTNFGRCEPVKKFKKFTVEEIGVVNTEQAIMQQIYKYGPLSCGINSKYLPKGYRGGVIEAPSVGPIDHSISVVGWGEEGVGKDGKGGVKYWILRNSWGEYWGEGGFAKILRGEPRGGSAKIESYCVYSIPKNTWDAEKPPKMSQKSERGDGVKIKNLRKVEAQTAQEAPNLGDLVLNGDNNPLSMSEYPDEIIKSPTPASTIKNNDLPEEFFWGDYNSLNLLSWTTTTLAPHLCKSSWAQSALSSLSDRINIRNQRQLNSPQRVSLSVQQVINCGGGGNCQSGSLSGVFKYGYFNFLVGLGCQAYQATDTLNSASKGNSGKCSSQNICMDCEKDGFGKSSCFAKPRYQKWRVSEYGKVRGEIEMKKEVYARGPIVCAFEVSSELL